MVSSFFYFFLPILSCRRLDVYHTSTHGVVLVRISDAHLKRAACGSLKIQDVKIAKNSPSAHHRTISSGYTFATKAHIDKRKNLLNSNISPTCPYNMVNFRPLAAQINSLVWGTPANFNGFCVLAALLLDTLVVGPSQTLQHSTEGATYIRQRCHHVGHWPTFYFKKFFSLSKLHACYYARSHGTIFPHNFLLDKYDIMN